MIQLEDQGQQRPNMLSCPLLLSCPTSLETVSRFTGIYKSDFKGKGAAISVVNIKFYLS